MNDIREKVEKKLADMKRILKNIELTKNMSDTELRRYNSHSRTSRKYINQLKQLGFTYRQIANRSIREQEYWSRVFAGSNLPDEIREGYDIETLVLFSEAAENGVPSFEEAVDFWGKNLAFNYGMKLFTEQNFQNANSLYKLWLACAFTAESIRQGAYPDRIKQEARRLLMETAKARARDYSPEEGLSIAVLAANIDKYFELAKQTVLSTNPPVRSSSSYGHLYK